MFGRSKSERCSAEDEQPSPRTLVLPDLPDEEETAGEPLAYVGPPRTRSRRRRIAAAAAAIALAAVMAGGGSLGAYSFSGSAPASGHHAFGGVVLTPAFLAHLRSASATAKPAPAKKPKSPKQAASAARTRSVVRAARAALLVEYRIDDDSGNGFTAEVDVTNNGSAPVTTWVLVLTLPGDHFMSWWNASGQASDGILLLTQPTWQGPVTGHGGRLRVYLNVSGERGTPTACSVNGVKCGRA